MRIGVGNLNEATSLKESRGEQFWEAVSSDCHRIALLKPHLNGDVRQGMLPLPRADQPCFGAGLASFEGSLFLCGGWDDGDEDDSEASEIWDTRTESWVPLPELPPQVACRIWQSPGVSARQLSICANTLQSKLTCPAHLSAVLPHAQRCKMTTNHSWRFDLDLGEWESLPPMANPRAEVAVGVLNGDFYVCGGMEDRSRVSASCESFNPQSGQWDRLPSMLRTRAWAAAGSVGGRLCVCGGFGDDGQPLSSAEWYDPSTNTWELVDSPALKKTDAGFSIVCASYKQ